MKKALNKFLFILLLTGSSHLFAQIDTVFWFAAPWITKGHNDNKPLALRISTFSNTTTVRVRQPANSYDTTFIVPPNTLFTKFLNHIVDSLENIPADRIKNRGLKITSNYPITVVWDFITPVPYNPETYSLKGQNGMGLEFVCPFQTKGDNGGYSPTPKSQIDIVATQNATVIWITPRCNVIGHLAGVTYSISLNAGQSYGIENVTRFASVAGQNLGGTIIVANKPITVSVSDDSVGGVGGCYDLMGDQIVPVDIVGKEYIINKGGLNSSQFEGAYIVATENFTGVIINDGATTYTVLNKGDTYFYKTAQPLTYVQADKNVYLLHASGFGCELGEALLPPINCAGSNQVSFSRNTSTTQSFFINVLCKSGSEGNFKLNGSAALVPASSFTTVPGTGGIWKGAQIQYNTTAVPLGSANLITNNNPVDSIFALGIINGAPTEGCLYHYMSSFLRRVYTTVGPDQNICSATTTIALTGTVQGGATTGIWTTIGGTGSFASATSFNTTYSLSPSDLGLSELKFVLSSTGNCNPVRDTMVLHIFKSPVVTAGASVSLCKNNIHPVTLGGTLNFAAGANWTSSGSGSFGSTGALVTTYLASPADLLAGSVTLSLTSVGSLSGCPNTYDSLKINFTNSPTVAISPDAYVCANNPTIAISGTVTGGSTTGIWTTSGTGLFTPSTTSLSSIYQLTPADISSGSVIIKLTSTLNGNCLAVFDSLILTVSPTPVVNAGINDTICSSNIFYNLNGSVTGGASAGIWTTMGNGTFGSTTALNTIYTLGSADTLLGQVKIVLTSTGSDCLPVTDTLLLTIAKSPLVNAGPNGFYCDNQRILLNGSVNGLTTTGAWTTLGTGIFTPDDSLLTTYYQPSPLDISNGFVNLLLTSTYNKGCSAVRDTIKITFKPAPNADFISNNECAKKAAIFTDNSTTSVGTITSWWWNFGDATTAISSNANHIYTTPGSYTVAHVANSSNGCTDTIYKPITIYFLPNAMFYQNTPCVGNITQFVDSTKTLSGSIIAWNWNFGDLTGSGVQNPQHAFSAATNYTVSLIVTSSFGCKDTVTKVVTVIPGPNADFSINPNPVEALEQTNLTDLSTGPASLTNWNWYFGDSTASNIQNPPHIYNNPGNYMITLAVKDINGCIDTVRKEISVVLLPDIPTAFSPNNDGQNDYFLVRGGPFKSINVRIYNNWGQLIFETNDQLDGWNGTFNGTEQPIGVYVWVLDVEMFTGKRIKKTGDVTLLR